MIKEYTDVYLLEKKNRSTPLSLGFSNSLYGFQSGGFFTVSSHSGLKCVEVSGTIIKIVVLVVNANVVG